MAGGPGKYDDVATMVRTLTGADAVMVLIIGGSRGGGFSLQMRGPDTADPYPQLAAADTMRAIADALRKIAEEITQDAANIESGIIKPHRGG
jgi:hypothetical protein